LFVPLRGAGYIFRKSFRGGVVRQRSATVKKTSGRSKILIGAKSVKVRSAYKGGGTL